MDINEYRDRMTHAHQQFATAVQEMLRAYGTVQGVFTDLVRDIDTHLTELHENDVELKRLILEQGAQIRELRDRLDGQNGIDPSRHP